jgi:flagellar protein FliS
MDSSVRNSYLENKILSADAVELVQILYQSALEAVENARRSLQQGEIAARSKQIGKACVILTELTISLNHDAGGDLSRTLADLYDYMRRRLLEANFKQIEPPLAEVSKLLATLLEGWLNCKVSAPAPAAQAHPPVASSQVPSGYAPQSYAAQYAPPENAWPADPDDEPVSPHRRITVSY